jgi:hypothetical protein
MGPLVRSKKMAVSEPSLAMTALDYSLPPCGGGLGRGVSRKVSALGYPLSNSPPQGRREQTEYVARLWIQFSNSDRRSRTRVRALATRSARGFALPSAQRGRGERRMPVAPAAPCALCISRTHTSNNEHTGNTRHSRTQWFYDLFRALPRDRALLPPSPAD